MEKFLVIDDSSTIQKVVQLAFAPYAVDIAVANSYIEAINAGSQNPPHLVIADASLPGIKGAQDYFNLQKRLRNIPFVILVGSYDSVDQASFHQLGFHSFLAKPFEAADLVATAWNSLGHEVGPRHTPVGAPPPPPTFAGSGTHSKAKIPLPPLPSPPVPSSAPGQPEPAEPIPDPPSSMVNRIDISNVSYEKGSLKQSSPVPISLEDTQPPQDSAGHAETTELEDAAPFSMPDQPLSEVPQDLFKESAEDDHFGFDQNQESELLANNNYEPEEGDYDEHGDYEPDNAEYRSPDMIKFETEMARSETTELHTETRSPTDDMPNFSSIDQEGSFTPPPPPPDESSEGLKSRYLGDDHEEFTSEEEGTSLSLGDMERVQGLLEPFLRDEMVKIVEKTVLDYCERHFAKIAREIITKEIKTLSSEKARLLSEK